MSNQVEDNAILTEESQSIDETAHGSSYPPNNVVSDPRGRLSASAMSNNNINSSINTNANRTSRGSHIGPSSINLGTLANGLQGNKSGSLLAAAVDARDKTRATNGLTSRRTFGATPRTTKHGEKLVLFPIDNENEDNVKSASLDDLSTTNLGSGRSTSGYRDHGSASYGNNNAGVRTHSGRTSIRSSARPISADLTVLPSFASAASGYYGQQSYKKMIDGQSARLDEEEMDDNELNFEAIKFKEDLKRERIQKRRQEEAQMLSLLQKRHDSSDMKWNLDSLNREKSDTDDESQRFHESIHGGAGEKENIYGLDYNYLKSTVGLTPWYSEANEVVVPDAIPTGAVTEAEKLPKGHREHFPKVTSYCIGDTIRIKDVHKLLINVHSVGARIFDECLYVVYEGDIKEKYFGYDDKPVNTSNSNIKQSKTFSENDLLLDNDELADNEDYNDYNDKSDLQYVAKLLNSEEYKTLIEEDKMNAQENKDVDSSAKQVDDENEHNVIDFIKEDLKWMSKGEVFIFDYGVIVFWNFTDQQEIAFFNILSNFVDKPLVKDKIQFEEFHYQYDLYGPALPRIFNDMITLKSGSLLIKLTISHALGQSVKLTLYENEMEENIERTIPLPRTMAQTGEFNLTRTEIMKIVGRLFQLKVNVNLVSNVLDTPEIFWLEPELDGLYSAMRSYMEISQRTDLLNSRADIINDLLDMLTDHMDQDNMKYITLIIIILIIIAVIVALVEVGVKLLISFE